MATCKNLGCEREVYAKGLCKRDHNRAFLETHPGYANRARARYRRKYPHKMKELHRRLTGRFSSGKTQAKRREVPWALSLDRYVELIAESCHWCGGELNETGTGLDRLDNRLGYVEGNVVPSCWHCNTLKGRIEGLGFRYPRTTELMEELMDYKRKYSPKQVAEAAS